MDACTKSALLLDILNDINSLKIRKKMIEILKNWSTANDLFERLPAPIPVVKKWVKVSLHSACKYLAASYLSLFLSIDCYIIWYACR